MLRRRRKQTGICSLLVILLTAQEEQKSCSDLSIRVFVWCYCVMAPLLSSRPFAHTELLLSKCHGSLPPQYQTIFACTGRRRPEILLPLHKSTHWSTLSTKNHISMQLNGRRNTLLQGAQCTGWIMFQCNVFAAVFIRNWVSRKWLLLVAGVQCTGLSHNRCEFNSHVCG